MNSCIVVSLQFADHVEQGSIERLEKLIRRYEGSGEINRCFARFIEEIMLYLPESAEEINEDDFEDFDVAAGMISVNFVHPLSVTAEAHATPEIDDMAPF